MGRKTIIGFSQDRILEYCRERSQGAGIFLGSSEDLFYEVKPDWDVLPAESREQAEKTFYQ